MSEQEEGIETVSFLDGLISQETRRRTREQTQPFIDACCSPGCIRSTVLTVGIASLLLTALLITIFLTRGSSSDTPTINQYDPPSWMLNQVTTNQLVEHMQFLSSDLLEGRAPGTRGEALTTGYIASHFLTSGLHPINNTYVHNVPMRGLTAYPGSLLHIMRDDVMLNFTFGTDFTADSDYDDSYIELFDTPIVFGGNCLYSTKYGTIPFANSKGDMVGTIVVCLVGPITYISAPDFHTVAEYYASISYKLAYLRSLNVKGVLFVHTEQSTGYAWDVFQNRYGAGEQLALQNSTKDFYFKGWIREQTAQGLARMCNSSLQEWMILASTTQFVPVKLPALLNLEMEFSVRFFNGQLVMGYLGPPPSPHSTFTSTSSGTTTGPNYTSVLLMAHHDNLGIRPVGPNSTDAIFNGAVDNASGVSGILAAAYALGELYKSPFIIHPNYDPPPLKKTIIFMTTTGKENMLGSTYFTKTNFCGLPLCGATIAFNFDVMNMWGSTLGIDLVGKQMSTVVDTVADQSIAAENLNSNFLGIPQPLGDEWPFILNNCTSVSFATSSDVDPNPIVNYMATKQYRPTDQFTDDMKNMTGLQQQVRVTLRMAYTLAVTDPQVSLTPSFLSLLQEIKNVMNEE